LKAVFFDWDGTLVDSLPMLFKAHNHARVHMGHPEWTREEYMKAIVYSSRELYPRLYGDRAEEARAVLTEFINANHINQIKVLEGAQEVLDYLHEQEIPMGIVSNKTHEFLVREIEHLGWNKYFGIYNGAGIAEKDKPSGVPLIHALGMHPLKPDIANVLYVGDMESDLGCAAEAGCPIAFIKTDPRSEELISRYQPDYVVNNLIELKEVLAEFLAAPAKKQA